MFVGQTTSVYPASPSHNICLAVHTQLLIVEEVTMAIIRPNNEKSAGIDGIQAELLKYEGEEMTRKILQLCNRI